MDPGKYIHKSISDTRVLHVGQGHVGSGASGILGSMRQDYTLDVILKFFFLHYNND